MVTQALPAYAMQSFLLPKSFCKELQHLMVQFWWSSDIESRKIHWMSWEKMCRPEHEGGLGFRDLYAFNLPLLAKQGWRLIHHPESTVARVLKAKYFKGSTFWDVEEQTTVSYVWKSILKSRSVFEQGSRWAIGNVNDVQVWKGRWILLIFLHQLLPYLGSFG